MPATLTLSPDGAVEDASDAALDLLGVTLSELLALPQGAFSPEPPDPEADAAFRAQWEAEGRPDIGGEATLQRLDGSRVRVRFAISSMAEGGYLAALEPIDAPVEAAPTLFTGGQVLSAWRAAERRLTALEEGSPEWDAVTAEIERFRSRYQELFRR